MSVVCGLFNETLAECEVASMADFWLRLIVFGVPTLIILILLTIQLFKKEENSVK